MHFKIKKNDGTEARETFLVNEEQYNNIIKLMQKEVKQFTKEDVDKLIELEKMKQITENLRGTNDDNEAKNETKKKELDIELEKIILQQKDTDLKKKRIKF